jgi:hypothetical protein
MFGPPGASGTIHRVRMRITLLVALVAAPAIARADADGFVQGVVGYSSPVAGQQYMDGVESGSARVGVRGGWMPLRTGHARLGAEVGIDWRPLGVNGGTAQQVRALIGSRIAFVAERHAVFFRLAVGYDRLYLDYNVNANGFAVEPGFGAAYRYQKLIFGAEVDVPLILHPERQGDDYMDGFAGADLQIVLSVGAEL